MFRNHLKIAFRKLTRNPAITAIHFLGLSIGVSAAIVIFLVVRHDYSFDRFYSNSSAIYRVVNAPTEQVSHSGIGGVDGALPEAARHEVTGLDQVVPFFFIDQFALNQKGVQVPDGQKVFGYTADMILADQRFFELFPGKWLAGNKEGLKQPFTVVISRDKADKYFPGRSYEEILGRKLVYGDSITCLVVGVVDEPDDNTDLRFNDFISYSTAARVGILRDNVNAGNWGSLTPSSQLFVQLNRNATVTSVEKQLNEIMRKNLPVQPGQKAGRTIHLERLSDVHFDPQYSSWPVRTANRQALTYLLWVGIFILLLACINYINLSTAQSIRRAKEIGIRKTIGSSMAAIATQSLVETLLLSAAAVVAGCGITPLLLHLFQDFIPPGLKPEFRSPGSISFLLSLIALISVAAGLYPALVISRYKPIESLKPVGLRSGESQVKLRQFLSLMQLGISLFFIMATSVVGRQIYFALHKDPGFKKEAIVTISMPYNADASLRKLYTSQVKNLATIKLVSTGGESPASDNTHSTNLFYLDGKKEIKTPVQERFGDENYTGVYGIKLLAGTNIRSENDSETLLINEIAARSLGFDKPEKAVNAMVSYSGRTMRVAGVMGDFYYRSLHTAIEPTIIVNRKDNSFFSSTLHIALQPETEKNRWKTVIETMQKMYHSAFPGSDFSYRFFDTQISELYHEDLNMAKLLRWATLVSVLISCMGILGLTMFTTQQRRKEIAVRKVLGASVPGLTLLLNRDLIRLIFLAFLLAWPLAWWMTSSWTQSFAERVSGNGWVFALSGCGLLLVALITTSVQTIRAASTNPVRNLRAD